MTLLNNLELNNMQSLTRTVTMRYMLRDHGLYVHMYRVSAVLTEKSHWLADTSDIILSNI